MQELIEAAEVKRDEDGNWFHPDMPPFDEGDGDKYKVWLAEQGSQTTSLALAYEDDTHPAYIAYFDEGESSFAGWRPDAPTGEGWFLLAIGDTEDGPQATFARRAAATTSTEGR